MKPITYYCKHIKVNEQRDYRLWTTFYNCDVEVVETVTKPNKRMLRKIVKELKRFSK